MFLNPLVRINQQTNEAQWLSCCAKLSPLEITWWKGKIDALEALEDLHRLATEIEANPLGHPRAALKLRVTGASQVGCLGLTGAGCTSWAGKGVNMPQDGGGRWVRWAWGSNMI